MVRHLDLLCEGLQARGFLLSIAAPSDFPLSPLHPFTPSRLHHAPITARPHPLFDWWAARRVARLAREADLLHGHGLRGAWIAALAARRARKPWVFTAHNLAPAAPGLLTRTAFRVIAARVERVICISQAVADSLTRYGIPKEKVVLIPNGIDLAPFDQPLNPDAIRAALGIARRPAVAAIGRLSPEKGFDRLIEAAPAVLSACPDAQFVLAGEGSERDRLEALLRARGLTERFELAGRIEEVPALLAVADVVAVPSLSEGQGLVALEAMAARKPVVASRVGGLVETIEEGVTGLLVPPGDTDALAQALIRLLSDPEARARMGSAGRARVEERYTAARMVDRTAELYAQVLRAGAFHNA